MCSMKISRKCAALVLAVPTCLIAIQIILNTIRVGTISATDDERKRSSTYSPLLSSSYFDQLTKIYSDASYNPPKQDWKKRKKQDDEDNYHDYPIFIVMYHKTGFVLTRQLKNMVSLMEIETQRPGEKDTYFKRAQHSSSGIDIKTGERFAFDTIGGWARSAFAPRRHSLRTNCPRGYRSEPFQLKRGTLYLQESPDIFCNAQELDRAFLTRKAKIVHFVRDPFDMVLSNYFYHSQEPSPEKWVYEDNPCHVLYDRPRETVASHVLQTIGSTDEINIEYFARMQKMCKSLFQATPETKNLTFYEHLLELDSWDGLRLATAQMIAASGNANKHLAGGDVLRMANNIIRFQELQNYNVTDVEVLTLSTDDFIKSPANSTMRFLDFVFGANNTVYTAEKKWEAALSHEKGYNKTKKNSHHVTQSTTQKEKKSKEKLKELLQNDEVLAPILKKTQSIVDNALVESEKIV